MKNEKNNFTGQSFHDIKKDGGRRTKSRKELSEQEGQVQEKERLDMWMSSQDQDRDAESRGRG